MRASCQGGDAQALGVAQLHLKPAHLHVILAGDSNESTDQLDLDPLPEGVTPEQVCSAFLAYIIRCVVSGRAERLSPQCELMMRQTGRIYLLAPAQRCRGAADAGTEHVVVSWPWQRGACAVRLTPRCPRCAASSRRRVAGSWRSSRCCGRRASTHSSSRRSAAMRFASSPRPRRRSTTVPCRPPATGWTGPARISSSSTRAAERLILWARAAVRPSLSVC